LEIIIKITKDGEITFANNKIKDGKKPIKIANLKPKKYTDKNKTAFTIVPIIILFFKNKGQNASAIKKIKQKTFEFIFFDKI